MANNPRDFLISVRTEFSHGKTAINKVLWNLKKNFKLISASSVYRVASQEKSNDVSYLSFVLRLQSSMSLTETGQCLHETQDRLGDANLKYRISIQFLTFGYEIVSMGRFSLPDPEMHSTPELIIPSAEVWPDYVHPVLGKKLKDLTLNLTEFSPMIEFYSQGGALLDFSAAPE